MGAFELPRQTFSDDLYRHSLPGTTCLACRTHIHRRVHRITIRASWRGADDILCMACWYTMCRWAQRFALQQAELPGMPDPNGTIRDGQ